MNDPRNISIQDYTYYLPEEKIASHPLTERDASRLLIYEKGIIKEGHYRDIADRIPGKSVMIFNNTKVIEARLLFQKPTGGTIEIFCLAPHAQHGDISSAIFQTGKVYWQCLVGGASKWKKGQVLAREIHRGETNLCLQAVYVEKKPDCFIIEFSWTPPGISFADILHYAGAIPLPPYIKRRAEETDAERYQTVYARHQGSVAAPTAGLHFTGNILTKLGEKNIRRYDVTLHVGAGTFKPVKSATLQGHEMHEEFFEVSHMVIKNILDHLDEKIIAVGTTSLRTIETLYWIGVKLSGVRPEEPGAVNTMVVELGQWEAYALEKYNVPVKDALQALLKWMEKNNPENYREEKIRGRTQLLIAPGYAFRIVNGLVTNFHQPQSTLLLLVAAFIGERWRKVYEYALDNDFRFLSYGDGCLLWRD